MENELYRVAAANPYYAMFWAAQVGLRHVGVVRSEWSHGALQQTFGLEIIKKRGLVDSPLGNWLSRAYELRDEAHYGERGVGIRETRRMLHHAAEFVASIEEVIVG